MCFDLLLSSASEYPRGGLYLLLDSSKPRDIEQASQT